MHNHILYYSSFYRKNKKKHIWLDNRLFKSLSCTNSIGLGPPIHHHSQELSSIHPGNHIRWSWTIIRGTCKACFQHMISALKVTLLLLSWIYSEINGICVSTYLTCWYYKRRALITLLSYRLTASGFNRYTIILLFF